LVELETQVNENGVQQESEFVFRRLTETFKPYLYDKELDGRYWLVVLGVVLLVGLFYVGRMYSKDSRTIRWFWATPLALLRIFVYLLLAVAFLMPAKQDYERVEKRSRVLVVLDVSDSMTQIADDPAGARTTAKPATRINKVMDYLSNEQVGWLSKLLDKNPVFVYRIGNRLDEDAQIFEKTADGKPAPVYRTISADSVVGQLSGAPWQSEEWNAFAAYNFKPYLLRGLSDDGIAKVKASPAWDGTAVGNLEWAQKWLDRKDEVFPPDLSADDKATLAASKEKLPARMDIARSIGTATNIPDSLLAAINRETGNMVQGIVVFSDGQSNLGNDSAIAELKRRSKNENIPIFTVAVGSEQKTVAVRITDVQAPEQTPPDEPFKVIVEMDGEGLVGQRAQLSLEIQLPSGDVIERVPAELSYLPGEPPHGQVEIVIDPAKVPDSLKSKTNPKELVEGDWKIRAVTPRVEGERFVDKEHVSEWSMVRVQKKPMRILLFCQVPSRDCQFLITQFLRDKADISIVVQNTGGETGKINLLDDPERQLTRFPDRLKVEDDPTEKPEEKWYNLARYDVIIAFDPDWQQLSAEQISLLRTWIDLQAGGLLYVAGPINTKHLARPDADDKFRPLNDILPVLPGDLDLAAARRITTNPWRLEFDNLGGDLDFMKLDDTHATPELAWEQFFTGRDDRDEKAKILRGFFNYYPVREMKPVATPVARFPDPNCIKLPDGKQPPWLAVMQYGQGRTAWLGSGELYRLRGFNEAYFERFWTKLSRYLSAGSRRKQTRRGRILMSKEIGIGGYVRVTAQLLDGSLKPMPANTDPKITFRPVELDRYPAEIEKLTGEAAIAEAKAKYHAKFTYESKMAARKTQDWEGYFQKSQLANAEKFPTGTWRADVEIPSSSESLRQKFSVRQSNPELDITRTDLKALYQMASDVASLNLSDPTLTASVQAKATPGVDGKRLSFKLVDQESLAVIPEVIKSETKTLRNRGAIVDYWDKGVELPRFLTGWFSDKPMRVGGLLLIAVTLLSLEWIARKLLKLA
jgi:hypothetical protein